MSLKEEQTGKFYFPHKKEIITLDNPFAAQAEEMRLEKDAKEATNQLLELAKQKQEELEKKLEKLELLPMGAKVILLPYPSNPYRRVMNGNIIVEYNGEFNNPDSGEKDKMKELVACAKIIEIGPDVKQVLPGDDVFYDPRSTYPVPFFNNGYILTTEPQLLCVLNEGLKKRFGMPPDINK